MSDEDRIVYEYRVQIVHDDDCQACNFTGGFVTADLRYCTTCACSLSAPRHFVRGNVYCKRHADEEGFPVIERRVVGPWEPTPSNAGSPRA